MKIGQGDSGKNFRKTAVSFCRNGRKRYGFGEERGEKPLKYFFVFLSVLGLDMGTKAWVKKKLPLHEKKEILPERFYLRHIKNGGMAYNTMEGHRNTILFLTGGLLLFYGLYFLEMLSGRREKQGMLPLAVVLAGGLGNFLERYRNGEVTDFLYIRAKNALVFNFADIAVAAGALGMTMSVLGGTIKNKKRC